MMPSGSTNCQMTIEIILFKMIPYIIFTVFCHWQVEKMMEEKLNIMENCHKLETEVMRLGGEINTVTGLISLFSILSLDVYSNS